MLDYPERKFTKWLEFNRWAFRQGGKGPLQAYSDKRRVGYLEHKPHTYTDQHTSEEKTRIQIMIAPKGIARLAKLLPVGGAA
ncbi:MAG: phage antirepressor KilAC domain-containing protein [Rhodobacteraceae bacterium]|nr:phage antirepressor KilAC domain-containing protein [Paracoccaceae bacterium]